MRTVITIARYEIAFLLFSPVSLVFVTVFLALSGVLTFSVGDFLGRGRADLDSFFLTHIWLYLFLIPALGMRLWTEERKQGTLELLTSFPVSLAAFVLGKFVAAWFFSGVTLLLTFPLWISVNVLGTPDNGAIFVGYVGSWLVAGSLLAFSSLFSVLTSNQVVAFIVAAAFSFLLMTGGDLLADVAAVPEPWAQALPVLSLAYHFRLWAHGVIEAPSLIFFISTMFTALMLSVIWLNSRRAA